MPSWPTRLFLGSSAYPNNSTSTLSTPANEFPTPLRSPPSRPSSNSLPRRTSQHGRSISHPFPSIFGSGKKKSAKDEVDDEDDDDDVVDAKTQLVGMPANPTADLIGHPQTVSPSISLCRASVHPLNDSRSHDHHQRNRCGYSNIQARPFFKIVWLIPRTLIGLYLP